VRRVLRVLGIIFGGLCALAFVLIALAFVFPSAFGPRYTEVTLASGRCYKVTSKGPIFGKGWRGLAVSCITDTEDPSQLEAAASELFELVRREAESDRVGGVVIMTNYSKSRRVPLHRASVRSDHSVTRRIRLG
jgi:hypothetical protein